ncbi:MAG: ISKra4 family transposase, partial [Streptosporangiaceae bacterium]
RLVGELAGLTLTGRRAGRRAEADGNAAAAVTEAEAAAITARRLVPMPPAGPVPDKIYLAIDGTGVPMVAAETAGRAGKGDDGRARTREVKMAAVFTQTRLGDDGHPVRDPGSSSYLATFAAAPEFGILMAAEARRRGAGQIRQLTILGDGAVWIWNLATQHFPAATQIVDLFHAREHVHELANLAGRLLAGHRGEWLAARLAELDAGDVAALLTAGHDLRFHGSLASERDKALHYFETNAHRMRYAWYRSLGLFVGSGTVEAGCKAVIGQRLKLSGMRWTEPGATGILTLRCHDASNRWEHIWMRPNNQTPAA